MATDGSLVLTKNPNKYYPRIEGNSISQGLIKQVYDFMVSIGMDGHFYLAKRKGGYYTENIQQQYRFQFNGSNNLFILYDKIGFVNPKYEDKFKLFLKYSDEYNKSIENIPLNKQKFFRIKSLYGSGEI